MAEKAIVDLDIKINAANSANTVKDLKTNLKSLKDELNNVPKGSEAFNRLSKAINETEGKLGDLNDSFKTLTGSGVERASSSLGLLREGFANLDFEKVKIGLNGLRTALAATGIMLLVQGVTYLIQNFDELKESTGILGTIMRGLGTVIDAISEAFYKLTDAIGLTNSTLDKYADSIKKIGESSQQLLAIQNQAYDNQIAKLKALGKETYNLEQDKLNNQKNTLAQELKMLNDLNAKRGQLTKEEKERRLELSLEIGKINNQIEVNEIEHTKKLNEEYLKRKELLTAAEMEVKTIQLKSNTEIKEATLQIKQEQYLGELQYRYELEDALSEIRESGLAHTKQSLQIAADLTSWLYAQQLQQAKGNAQKELEIKKKAFKAEQAFKVANIVIDTTMGMIKAISQNPPPSPVGIISAALVGLAGTLATVKVLTTKFNENGGGGSVGQPPLSSGAVPQPINQVGNTSTLLVQADQRAANPTQPMQPVKAYVVETEATETIKRVSRIEEKSKIN